MSYLYADEALLDRMVRAVEKVRDRLRRAAAALERSGVPYAVAGGNAVAAWVATVDESAIRNTPDVEILLGRDDLPAAVNAMEAVGFVYAEHNAQMFLDSADLSSRHGVRICFALERDGEARMPVTEFEDLLILDQVRFLSLATLVKRLLLSNRTVALVLVRDLLDVGLIDASWCKRLPAELAARLQHLLDTPEG